MEHSTIVPAGTPAGAADAESLVAGFPDVPQKEHADAEVCTICLSAISERAVATPCNHLSFDFLCLAQWVQTSTRCPLCATPIEEIQYDWRAPLDFKRYMVPPAVLPPTGSAPRLGRTRNQSHHECQPLLQPSLARRRYVYEHNLYSSHVGSNGESGYTQYSTAEFLASSDLQSRARAFLRRELAVLDSLLRTGQVSMSWRMRPRMQQATVSYLVEFVVAVLRTHDPQAHDGRAQELLADFMPADTARLLLHELTAWLRSPYTRLQDWDAIAQYASPSGS